MGVLSHLYSLKIGAQPPALLVERIAFEDQILICSKTYEAVKDFFTVEKIDHVNLRGIEGERSIYNVIDNA